MAQGTILGTTDNRYIQSRIVWSAAADAAANASDVTAAFELCKSSASSSATSGRGSWSLTIDGTAHALSATSATLPANGVWQRIGSVTVRVPHNDDGTKSAAISVTGGMPNTSYKETYCSGTAVFDAIARASGASLSAAAVDAGSAFTVRITRASSAFTHRVTYRFGTYSVVIAEHAATEASYTIPREHLTAIPNAQSGTATVTVQTYSGSTAIGSPVSLALTVRAPADVLPSVSGLTAERIDGSVPPGWGVYVQGKSRVRLTFGSASGAYGSTIESYSVSGIAGTEAVVTSGVITGSGTLTYTGTVLDSRGRRSAPVETSITVYPYSVPRISNVTAFRCSEDGTSDPGGTYISVTAQIETASIGGHNSCQGSVSYKTATETVFGEAVRIESLTPYIFGPVSTTDAYDVRITLEDTFARATFDTHVPTASRVFNVWPQGDGIAFGHAATGAGLDCGWDASFAKDVSVGGDASVDGDVSVGGLLSLAAPLALAMGGTGVSAADGAAAVRAMGGVLVKNARAYGGVPFTHSMEGDEIGLYIASGGGSSILAVGVVWNNYGRTTLDPIVSNGYVNPTAANGTLTINCTYTTRILYFYSY